MFTAVLGSETNTFCPLKNGLPEFHERMLWRPGEHPDHPTEQTAPLWICRQRAKSRGWEVVEGTCAFAAPAGPILDATYEYLRDEILAQLAAALPVDMIVLGMHGAMVAESYLDCEGDMLQRIRKLAGNNVPIGVEVDLHCHLTELMVQNTTAIIAFKEYPHSDYVERAEELVNLLESVQAGDLSVRMVMFDCQMIDTFHTNIEPMKSFMSHIRSLEGKDGVASISVIHSFPWADVPDLGAKILLIADESADCPERIAEAIGREFYLLRDRCKPRLLSVDKALERAVSSKEYPIVISDTSDNPGGGAGGDSTVILQQIIERGIRDVCIGPIYDPLALDIVFRVGEGSSCDLHIGGKLWQSSGTPIYTKVRVKKLVRDGHQTFVAAPERIGDAACVEFDDIEVVLTSIRCQALGTDLFTNLGIELESKKIIVVKSAQHFFDAFKTISRQILYVDSNGSLTSDLSMLKYTRVNKQIWPFVANPVWR